MADDLWMVVGLGNPGPRYADTRHNVGFMVVNELAHKGEGFSWQNSNRFVGQMARGTLGKHRVLLVMPQTFMNLSGRCVGPLAHFYRIPAERLVAVHDDVDLAPGRLKIKAGGGAGGHKGIRSMVDHLGDREFFRIRCGVGRPQFGEVSDYVLHRFDDDELAEKMVVRAAKAARFLMSRGLVETANRYNRR